MKKSILQFSVIAAIAASMTLTTSCSSDENVAEAYVPEPVQFGIDLGDMTLARANTRNQSASDTTKWTKSIDGMLAQNDIVHIWTTDADGVIYRKAYYVKEASDAATSAGSKNTLTAKGTDATGKFYWNNTSELKKYEIYSFGNATSYNDSANTTSARSIPALKQNYIFEVPSDQTVEGDAKEFLYGYGQLKYTASTIFDLKVAHQLARIDVKVITGKNDVPVNKKTDGTDLGSAMSASSTESLQLKIGWATMNLKGYFISPAFSNITGENTTIMGDKDDTKSFGEWDFTVAAGKLAALSQGQITPRVRVEQRYNESNKNFETNYSAVVMPQIFKGHDLFTIEYDGATYKYVLPAEATYDIEAGKKYLYTVKFEDTSIKVTVAISSWDSQDQGEVKAVLQAGS